MIPHTEQLNLGNNWTVETWVKINELGTDKVEFPLIMEKGESFGIWLDGNANGFGGYARFNDQSEAGFFQNHKLQQNKWYHVAITSNSATKKVKFYVHDEHRNLIFENSRDFPKGSSGELNHSNHSIFIGGVNGGSNIQFDGWFDELRITKEPVNYSSMTTKVESRPLSTEIFCYPNPITDRSQIQFSIAKDEKVNLSVFDIHGRKITNILNKNLPAGTYNYSLSKNLPSDGIYFLRLKTQEGIATRKFIYKNE
jgi:hypothetical protein